MNKSEQVSWEEKDKEGFVLDNFVKMDNALTREMICECGIQEAMLYHILLSHRNAKTNKCYPSNSLLAKQLCISERTISRGLKTLFDKKFILIDSGRQGITSTYFFPKEAFYNNEGCIATRRESGFKTKK